MFKSGKGVLMSKSLKTAVYILNVVNKFYHVRRVAFITRLFSSLSS